MEIGWFFITIAVTVLWCLGWYTITQEGQILGFVRKWLVKKEILEINLDKLKALHPSEQQFYRQTIYEEDGERTVLYVRENISYPWYGKPIATCVKCLSSIHGTLVFWFMVWNYDLMQGKTVFVFWVMNCIISSFLNDYFYAKRK